MQLGPHVVEETQLVMAFETILQVSYAALY